MALVVKLNGSNYVSDKTKAAFAQALASGRVSEKASERKSESANQREGEAASGEWRMANERKGESARRREDEKATTDYELRTTIQNPVTQYAVRSTPANLDQGLTHAYGQQQTTARVHEQYLTYQAEYAQLYAQLLQQQGAIFSGVNGDPHKAQLAAQVLETLAQSMARFHDLQTGTLNVHKQFLGQQADMSRACVRLLAGSGEQEAVSSEQTEGQTSNVKRQEQASERTSEQATTDYRLRTTAQNQKSEIENPSVASDIAPATTTDYGLRTTDSPRAEVPTPAINAAALQTTLLQIVSDKTGYPTEMLEPEMDMEADLGIDSIKRVEIMGALREAYPALPKTDPEVFAELRTLGQIIQYANQQIGEAEGSQTSTVKRQEAETTASAMTTDGLRTTDSPRVEAPAPTMSAGALQETLLAIVSDKTGYPAEMLELEMDMEADLGIDSIKRVEIMGALREAYPALPKTDPEVFAELRTLGQIVAYASERVGEKANERESEAATDAAPASVQNPKSKIENSTRSEIQNSAGETIKKA